MQGAEASRSRTCLLLKNNKQNMFTSENNLKFIKVLWIHNGPWIYKEKGSRIYQKIKRQKSDLGAYLKAPQNLTDKKIYFKITSNWYLTIIGTKFNLKSIKKNLKIKK